MNGWVRTVCLLLVFYAIGCRGDSAPRPGEAYIRRQPAIADTIHNPVDRPGAVQYDPVKMSEVVGEAPSTPRETEVRDVPAVVQDAVPLVGQPSTMPSTSPTTGVASTTAPALEPGGYMIVGFVLAQVRDRAIYAEQVLTAIDAALRAEARRLEPARFRPYARGLIMNEVRSQIQNELELAGAESQLTEQEKDLAEAATMQWKQSEITKAGGSEALAARKWEQNGESFVDRLKRENRTQLIRVYVAKKVWPRITVSASDMREYYERNLESQFSQRGQATFSLLRIGPASTEAREFAQTLRHRAAAGETLEQIALEQPPPGVTLNYQPSVGPIEKNAFRYENVEKAIWSTQPGQVTDVIEDSNLLFIAKTQSIQQEAVRPFSDLAVQREIKDGIEKRELERYRGVNLERLRANAVVIEPTDEKIDVTVDMAMQSYRKWRGE